VAVTTRRGCYRLDSRPQASTYQASHPHHAAEGCTLNAGKPCIPRHLLALLHSLSPAGAGRTIGQQAILHIYLGLDTSLQPHEDSIKAQVSKVTPVSFVWCSDTRSKAAMWGQLAVGALQTSSSEQQPAMSPEALVLLDDSCAEVSPPSWPLLALSHLRTCSRTGCLLLCDTADPGGPHALVLRAGAHTGTLRWLLPAVGAGLDDTGLDNTEVPLLCTVAEVYRRLGGLVMSPDISVTSHKVAHQSVPQHAAATGPATRSALLARLSDWCHMAATAGLGQGHVFASVDVLVPSYRVEDLRRVALRVHSACPDSPLLGLIIVVDDPQCPAATRQALARLQDLPSMRGRVRLGFNQSNMGASASRNTLLDLCLAEYVIFLDDDVQPGEGLLPAYQAAFRQHPEELGFAGPTLLPRYPLTPVSLGTHMSDVSFFWTAPLNMQRVPWAVTANLAVRNTGKRFDLRYPKTGGGEDVDFCLRACPQGLVAVPDAVAVHPWWNGGRPALMRFARWALGDGELVDVYPHLAYRAAPNVVEVLLIMAAAQLALVLTAAVSALPHLPVPLPRQLLISSFWPAPALWPYQHAVLHSMYALTVTAGAVLMADLGIEVMRNTCMEERLQLHPCPSWRLRLLGCLYSWAARVCSEGGRLWGHLRRGRLGNVCRRFDWFAGQIPPVVRQEQRWSALRLACYLGAVSAALSWAGYYA